ncbi:MAG: GGDEF domain-containing protein, partial [Planctomycetes bacterium]|nr:GGDEF domain-containing protein [Planctomycetota bacterium]
PPDSKDVAPEERDHALLSCRRIGVTSMIVAGVVVILFTVASTIWNPPAIARVLLGGLAVWFCFASIYAVQKLYQIANRGIHRLKDMAIIDEESWAFEYPYIQNRLQEEEARIDRHGGVASLLFVDAAGLHETGERFGSLDRSAVLKDITEIMFRNMRKSDVLARISEGIFLILLPETDRASAEKVAERMCSAAENYRHNARAGGKVDYVRFTIGVASYPFNGETINGVLRAAREAMEDAIRDGGDMAVISGQFFKGDHNAENLIKQIRE